MKLGELRSSIRTTKGNPVCTVLLPNGNKVSVAVQKSALMKALETALPGPVHRGTETGMGYDIENLSLFSDAVGHNDPESLEDDLGSTEEETDLTGGESLEDDESLDDDEEL